MGGYGSTRWGWHSKKEATDGCLKLDCRWLLRELFPHAFKNHSVSWNSVSWSRNGHPAGSISVCFDYSGDMPFIELRYTLTRENHAVRDRVYFQSESLVWGKIRWWFTCPQCECRCAMLYLPANAVRFLCRRCHQLSYTSAQEAHHFDRGALAGFAIQLERLEKRQKLFGRLKGKHVGSKAWKRIWEQIGKT